MNTTLVSLRSIGKTFNGIAALTGVSFDIARGSIHALMGENGAGKSTLIKILCGVHVPDSGSVEFAGTPLPFGSVSAATKRGIAVIHQEAAAFDDLSAGENIFIGNEPSAGGFIADRKTMAARTGELFAMLEEHIDMQTPVGELSTAKKQMVAIARALSTDAKLLIMDEPTAALSRRETETLFRIIRTLKERGITVLYISHRMEEIFALADTITVLRDGCHIRTADAKTLDSSALISLMVGRDLAPLIRKTQGAFGPDVLAVWNLSLKDVYDNISFTVRSGEIVCITGLVGAGRTEVMETIFGIRRHTAGTISIGGKALPCGSPARAVAAGIAFVPEERQREGLVLPMTVGENLIMAHIGTFSSRFRIRNRKRENAVAENSMRSLMIKAPDRHAPAASLSGGNQQKIVLGKWLAVTPTVLMLDEPTRGVDVGAKAEIYRILRDHAENGMAVLIVSSDLPEVLAVADRIIVMCDGRIAGELERRDATEEAIMSLALPRETAGVAE
ncbi:MAG: sugar ABC transporter ATP-binding protein [Spirochaetes bacterium]|nr:sugar ABC transporter ATP-binding protein [Spirochaetota bacterium]